MNANPDDDEYLDEEPPEEQRSIFATGWFRALVVLLGLAIVVVVSLPYLLDWMDQSRKAAPAGPTAPQQATAPSPAPAPAAPAGAPPPVGTPAAPKPETPQAVAPQPTSPAKPAPAKDAEKREPAQPAPAPARKAEVKAPAKAPARADVAKPKPAPAAPEKPKAAASGGDYWLQVGAYRDEGNATRTAEALRKQNLQVQTARVTRAPAGSVQHEVFVTGASAERVNAALRGAGSAQAADDGVVVRPALELKEAVALSKRLAAEGLQVKIRRTQGGGGAPAAFHLVRVGPYGDRAAAEAARKELEGKKVATFITQGPPR